MAGARRGNSALDGPNRATSLSTSIKGTLMRTCRLFVENLETRLLLSHVPFLSTTQWNPIGPAPIDAPGVAQGFTAGRIEAAAPHPANSDVMYIGGDNGGVWKTATWNRTSADGGPVWLPLTDDQPSLDFSGYHPLVVKSGPFGRDTILGAVSGVGAGILKSTDGGLGWQLLGNSQLEGASIGSIAVDTADLKTLYISVRSGGPGGGVYKSTDGGTSWQNTTAFHAGGAADVIMDPYDSQTLYAGLVNNVVTNGVYKTTDGGMNWNVMGDLSSAFFLANTVRLEAAPSAEGTVYATLFENELAGGLLVNYHKTTDGGSNWTTLATPAGSQEERAWHVLLAVDPQNADHVFVNRAYAIVESTDGGQTWTSFESIGDDWVFMTFDALNRPVATADRDLYSFDTATQLLDSREGNLQVTAFYDITLDPLDPELAYGVAQDHFDAMKFTGSIEWAYMPQGGGETGKVLVHPANSSHLYVSNPLNPANLVRRSTDGGQNWTPILNITDFDDEDYSLAYSVQKSFVMDPTNASRLLIGTNKVLETTNADGGSPTWSDFSPVLSTSSDVGDQYITALAVSADGKSVYAATSDGHVWAKHPSMFWTQTDAGLFGQGAGKVVEFEIDPSNPLRVYAVTSGPGDKCVWLLEQHNKSSSWVNVSGDFPTKLRAATIHVDWQFGPPALYVGSSRNVYHSVNKGQHWEVFGQFLPNTTVTDLQFDPAHGILAAGTYGRGAWEILVGASSISGQVYWDINGNGVKNVGDNGLAAVQVYLDVNSNAVHDAFERSTFTNAAGNYTLSNVAPGEYDLRQIPPAGFVQTTPTITNLFVNGSNVTGQNIGDTKRVLIKAGLAAQLAHLITVIENRQERLLDGLEDRPDAAQGGRSYSPHAFGPDEPRLHPGAVDEVLGRRRKLSDEEPYIFVGDLNDLPGRLPGQPIGAMGEFEHRQPPRR